MSRRHIAGLDADLVRVHDLPRHKLPLPPDRAASLPFVFVPGERVLIAPWPKRPASFVEKQRLTEVLDRVACSRPSAPVWI